MNDRIDSFTGVHEFLSNFYMSPVQDSDGRTWLTVEHAFQAAKTHDEVAKELIAKAKTPGQAKRLGQAVPLKDNWEEIKLTVMFELVLNKFRDNEFLKGALLETKGIMLIEGNHWHDMFWGVCKCQQHIEYNRNGLGSNHLGAILMYVRYLIINGQ